ncbi:MAG: bifunctional 4-hydroxy-2-oxoglutarate aldolase/2-dehydro-3-deoxy-phosphogluconate aldolase [Eudoraea sp.]|uniref:bifunctional 4-hydroxy-2-oxoglutarate aldolase/2-dehydro-3-deoxy-phosphogluconate aldolase n=2 Tax=Eudoraea sp. TaxID=1979955 RepID=UPI003C750BC4
MYRFSEDLFKKVPVVGILRGYTLEEVLAIVKVYYQEGFTNIEITMNTERATEIINEVLKQYTGKLNVGAGTVLSKNDVDEAIKAGAQFIVTPVTDPSLIKYCINRSIPVFPGAYTPSEIYACWKAGARMVKVFPASALSPSYIKDVMAPLNDLELMPTGGVTKDNLKAYLNAGAKAFGMGGYLFDRAIIEKKDWQGLAGQLRTFKMALD